MGIFLFDYALRNVFPLVSLVAKDVIAYFDFSKSANSSRTFVTVSFKRQFRTKKRFELPARTTLVGVPCDYPVVHLLLHEFIFLSLLSPPPGVTQIDISHLASFPRPAWAFFVIFFLLHSFARLFSIFCCARFATVF